MIYVVQARTTPYVKIGYCDSQLRSRMSALQTGCPHELVLLIAFPGSEEDEAKAHERFSHLSERGEWFRLEPELVAWIADHWAFRVANDVGQVRIAYSAGSLAFGVPRPSGEPLGSQPPDASSMTGNVLAYLMLHPDVWFAPSEVALALDLDRNVVCATLSRLRSRGLVVKQGTSYQAMKEEPE